MKHGEAVTSHTKAAEAFAAVPEAHGFVSVNCHKVLTMMRQGFFGKRTLTKDHLTLYYSNSSGDFKVKLCSYILYPRIHEP